MMFRRFLRPLLGAFPALLLAACVSTAERSKEAAICGTAAYTIAVGFEGAGDHTCTIDPAGAAVVRVRPEARPINPSPWYAFTVESVGDQPVRVRLVYETSAHRYPPKLRAADGVWRALPQTQIEISDGGKSVDLVIPAQTGKVLVAAQPVESAAGIVAGMRGIVAGAGFREVVYGRSVEGRPLVAFLGGPDDASELVVALTRQHPPERSGSLAFRAFAERIAAAPGNRRYVLVPVANPDGVDRGHWRGNAAGVDLNRDWGRFVQPESAALAALFEREAQGRRVAAMLDFHSTQRTVIYAPPFGRTPALDAAMGAFQRAYAALPAPPPWSHSHDPNGGTSKGWTLERFGALGLTIELADEAAETDARAIGRASAAALDDLPR
jgi:hypothetical protein